MQRAELIFLGGASLVGISFVLAFIDTWWEERRKEKERKGGK